MLQNQIGDRLSSFLFALKGWVHRRSEKHCHFNTVPVLIVTFQILNPTVLFHDEAGEKRLANEGAENKLGEAFCYLLNAEQAIVNDLLTVILQKLHRVHIVPVELAGITL